MSAKSEINQKEYLKKYLGIGKGSGEKKKKKKIKATGKGLKIVDDNVDIRLNEEIKLDLTADNDEAPIIVSVIDDRPPSLRIDEVTKVNLWQPIGAPVEIDNPVKSIKFEGNIKLSKKLGNKQVSVKSDIVPNRNKTRLDNSSQKRYGTDSDGSPPRRSRSDSNSVPKKKIKVEDDDNSPPRKRKESPLKKSNIDTDSSPPRKKRHSRADSSPPRKIKLEKDEDNSPPRRRRESPSARHNVDSDSSPPRKRKDSKKEALPLKKVKQEIDEDNSPPRRRRGSPPAKHNVVDNYSENSKNVELDKDDDHSPPRRRKESVPRRTNIDSDASPPRKRKSSPSTRKKSRWADNEEQEKMKTTLDGKTAGLQNAAELVKETERFKKREEEIFKNLSAEVSGANAATVVRKKNKEVDWEEEERKRKLEEETKEKYNRWGKGLKQVEDVNEKIKSDLHEMSKPLARYADDNDLETYLKEQEREGDPMLAYIRQKKKKKAVDEGKSVMQQFEGDAPPNRFGIRPGYRWDGVDRSSGYEKKWFEVQNSRQASMEENYKWSTEDM